MFNSFILCSFSGKISILEIWLVICAVVYLFDIGNCLSQTRGTSVNVDSLFV